MSSLPDYLFYTDAYYGVSIAEPDWPRFSAMAGDEVLSIERIYTVTCTQEQRDKAVCAVADELYGISVIEGSVLAVDERGAPVTSRVSIGGISASTDRIHPADLGFDLSVKGKRALFYAIIQKYASHICRGAPYRRCAL